MSEAGVRARPRLRWIALLAVVASVVLLVPTTANAAKPGQTNWPGGRWDLPAATYGSTVVSTQITMSDGVILHAKIGYPTDLATGQRAAGTFPVLLTQNPYQPSAGENPTAFFVTRGYIHAVAEV